LRPLTFPNQCQPTNHGPTLLIHGGAGKIVKKRIPCEEIPDEQKEEYLQAMREALKVGCDILKRGGRAVDAVVAAVSVMEGSLRKMEIYIGLKSMSLN